MKMTNKSVTWQLDQGYFMFRHDYVCVGGHCASCILDKI